MSVDSVVLLHGLARSARAMRPLQRRLHREGYAVHNLDYPSRRFPIEALVDGFLAPAVAQIAAASGTLHFVTHSMGGILVRGLLARARPPQLGRVVMLSPPSQGSEVVDRLRGLSLFRLLNGPAGQQLGTGPDALPIRLGPVDYPVGVITGTRSVNWLLSLLIPGENDGKVSVARARLAGMSDFLALPHSHPFIMQCEPVMAQTVHFLRHGRFHHDA